jgi:glucan 1,3-beta-glucosidase
MGFFRTVCGAAAALSVVHHVSAAPTSLHGRTDLQTRQDSSSSPFWMETIGRHGTAWGNENIKIFRNVKDYGAMGDGTTDDTDAINKAISDAASGNARCGNDPYCDSSTTTPAIVYFPSGNYLVSKPIVMYYYTQLIGNANELPTLTAAPTFAGMAVLDSDPYNNGGDNCKCALP